MSYCSGWCQKQQSKTIEISVVFSYTFAPAPDFIIFRSPPPYISSHVIHPCSNLAIYILTFADKLIHWIADMIDAERPSLNQRLPALIFPVSILAVSVSCGGITQAVPICQLASTSTIMRSLLFVSTIIPLMVILDSILIESVRTCRVCTVGLFCHLLDDNFHHHPCSNDDWIPWL